MQYEKQCPYHYYCYYYRYYYVPVLYVYYKHINTRSIPRAK